MNQKIQYNTYVIDFDRVNKLTAHPNDNPNNSTNFTPSFVYSHTRRLLKEYLDIYSQYNISKKIVDEETYLQACEVLHYNRVLVSQADLRDKKLNSVLNDNDDDSKYYADYDEDGFDDTEFTKLTTLNPNAQ